MGTCCNFTKIIFVLASLGLAAYTAYLFYYFCGYEFQLCEPIKNCTYNVVDYYDVSDFYFYYYIVNNQYKCGFPCRNSTDISSCPKNGSHCQLNDDVVTDCRLLGPFEPLFSCMSLWKQMLFPFSALAISCIFILIAMFIIISLWDYKEKTTANEASTSGLYKTERRPILYEL